MGENEATASEDSADSRVVIANGQDIDKQYFYEVNKQMARDWDLRKLAYLGPPLWTLLSIAVVASVLWRVGSGGISVPSAGGIATALLSGQLDVVVQLLVENAATILVAVALLGVFVYHLVSLAVDLVSDFRQTVVDLATILARSLRSFNPDVWQKSNYWYPFTTHLSGRDPLLLLTDDIDVPVSGLFSDGPHYGNVFVDSVFLSIDGDLTIRQRLFVLLYDFRWRWVRRLVFIVSVSVVFASALAQRAGFALTESSTAVQLGVVAALVVATVSLALHLATRYPIFFTMFLAESAAFSRYKRLLNEPESQIPSRDDGRIGLSNSMAGYGLFFVSEFLYTLFGYVRYDVSLGAGLLPDADGDSPDADAYPPKGYDDPNDAHASAAAGELLWSAIPRESVHAGGDDPDVELTVTGVDYYTTDSRPVSLYRRVFDRDVDLSDDDVADEEFLSKARAGNGSGIRLPVKKFMSVAHGLPVERLSNQQRETPNLYSFGDSFDGESDAALQWDEDTIHYVLLGGGEHQQAINKLVLSLKAQGYENVDVLENAFASVTTLDDADEDPRSRLKRLFYAGPPVDPDGIENPAFFPTEYFVSGVFGKEEETAQEFFRQNDDSFLFLRHELADEFVAGDNSVVFHVIIGMSAVGTKVGFLYWLSKFDAGFPGIADDTAYCVSHPGATDIDGVEDVGHLYLNSAWREQSDALTFEEDSETEPTGTTPEDGDSTGKQIAFDYYDLDITYDPDSA